MTVLKIFRRQVSHLDHEARQGESSSEAIPSSPILSDAPSLESTTSSESLGPLTPADSPKAVLKALPSTDRTPKQSLNQKERAPLQVRQGILLHNNVVEQTSIIVDGKGKLREQNSFNMVKSNSAQVYTTKSNSILPHTSTRAQLQQRPATGPATKSEKHVQYASAANGSPVMIKRQLVHPPPLSSGSHLTHSSKPHPSLAINQIKNGVDNGMNVSSSCQYSRVYSSNASHSTSDKRKGGLRRTILAAK